MGLGSKFLSKKPRRRNKSNEDQRLPVELIEEILLAAWRPLCVIHIRRSFISFFLVNRLWASLMKRIVLRYVRLDSARAVIWYDSLYRHWQACTITKPISGDDDSNTPIPQNPPNPRDLCKDLVMISTMDPPYRRTIIDMAVHLDFARIIPLCSQLERAQLNFGTTFIEPSTVADTLLQLTKLTDLHITALDSSLRDVAPQIPLADGSLQLTQIRDLTLTVLDARFTVAIIGICPTLRTLTLESSVESLEELSSYILRWFNHAPRPERNVGDRQDIVRPLCGTRDVRLRHRADSCIPMLKALLPLLP